MTDVSPAPEDRLQVTTDSAADPMTFVLEGELDPHTSPMLQSTIDDATEADATSIALDFAAVSFVDSVDVDVVDRRLVVSCTASL